MELDKKKYKREEVLELLKEFEGNYKIRLAEQLNRIKELSALNEDLLAQLSDYKNKEEQISKALIDATEKANELHRQAELSFEAETQRLKNFVERFNGYFSYLTEKYPYYEKVKDASELFENIKKTLESGCNTAEKIENIDGDLSRISKGQVFSPKAKIAEYIAATESNGFNMEEVLNPGKLELEDLCKEMGLMEEE